MDYLVVCLKANIIWLKFMTKKYALCVQIGVLLDFPHPVKIIVILPQIMALFRFSTEGQNMAIIDIYCRKLGQNVPAKVFAKFPLRSQKNCRY